MLTLLCSPKPGEKSEYILNEMKRLAESGRPSFLIVPENVSHQAERRLLLCCGNSLSRMAQVTTFTKIADQVLLACNRRADVLDGGGRVLLMYRALLEVQSSLQYYRNPAQRPQLISKLLELTDELKVCSISPEKLAKAVEDGRMEQKLADLSIIYSAYCSLCESSKLDYNDRLTIACDFIAQSGIFQDAQVFVEDFSGFTFQKYQALDRILGCSAGLTVSLMLGGDSVLFTEQERTKKRLLEMAKSRGCRIQVIKDRDEKAESGLPYALFDYRKHQAEDRREIKIYSAKDPAQECELAAAEMRQLLLKDDVRAREIMVVCDQEAYLSKLETACRRYGVPIFSSRRSNILKKPAVVAAIGALEALEDDLSQESMFKYLKSGLCPIDKDAVCRLENYVYQWNVTGKRWFSPFIMSTKGYGNKTEDEPRLLADINEAREQAAAPIMQLCEDMEECRVGEDFANAMGRHFERIDLEKRIEDRTNRLYSEGRRREGAEYAQLYNILIKALEQFSGVMGGSSMSRGEFLQLLRLMLAQYDVSTIPASLDSILSGGVELIPKGRIRRLFVLGAREGLLPPSGASASILSESERIMLEGAGVELTQTAQERAFEDLSQIYRVLSLPEDGIIFTCPRTDGQGGEYKESYLLKRARMLLGGGHTLDAESRLSDLCVTAPIPAFEAACRAKCEGKAQSLAARKYFIDKKSMGRWFEALETYAKAPRGAIKDPEVISRLYGNKISMTASRIERVSSCRFSYFMQYGLRAKPRKEAVFGAPEIGTFVHYVVEHAVRSLCAGGETAESATDRFVRDYIDNQLPQKEQTARFKAILKGFESNIRRIVSDTWEEIEAGDFRPIGFEVDFSQKGDELPLSISAGDVDISVNGKIDRVDGYVKNGRLYLKIVDYKTGRKDFKLSDVMHGLNLQMFLYMMMLQNGGRRIARRAGEVLGAEFEEISPCAALYVPVKNPYVQAQWGESEEQIRYELSKALRRKGIVSSDIELISALERPQSGKFRFLPVNIKKDGEFDALSSVADAEQMGRLMRHTERTLRDLALKIAKGDIEANPYASGKDFTVCKWCDFKAACHFDESMEKDRLRHIKSFKAGQVFELLKEEDLKEAEKDEIN